MADAIYDDLRHERVMTAEAALAAGALVQLPDGRAAVYQGANAAAAGDDVTYKTDGCHLVAKTAGVVLLDGQEVFWDHSAGAITFKRVNDRDFSIGTMRGDAASAATTGYVNLNVKPEYVILLGRDAFTAEATLGLGVTKPGIADPTLVLSFDAVAEAAQAAIISVDSVDHLANPILEAWVAVYDIGDDAALDINIGLAATSHATDFEAITNFVAVQLDGNALSVNVHSDDAVTDVAPVDSLIDLVDDTFAFVQIDMRNPASLGVYINGVYAVPDGTTLVATGMSSELKAIAHVEKTSNDTLADVRVKFMGVRTSGE